MYGKEFSFTETAGAGVYTASIPVTRGMRIIDIEWQTTATFDADTATLSVGKTGSLTDYINVANVKTAGSGAYSLGISGGKIGYKFTADTNLVLTLTTTGSGGTTGRLTALVQLQSPVVVKAAVKA